MEEASDGTEIERIHRQISELPVGSISYKTIKGKVQPYLQWTQDGRTRSRYLKADNRDLVIAQVEKRKQLEARLRELESQQRTSTEAHIHAAPSPTSLPEFYTNCLVGARLERFASMVECWKHRDCFMELADYLQNPQNWRVLVLYGLRRTGKSTMLRQAVLRMSPEERARTAYISITPADTLGNLNRDLRRLSDAGYRNVFIDEVTMLDDFIESASLFSDIYAAMGMKVVLSGTYSLGFLFSEDEQLYDRCTLVHTTLIPYREFERVLGIGGIDEYIRYGGTMSMGGRDYNKRSTFASAASAGEYVDSAIARNIQHSLRCYQHEGHFRHLQDLYEAHELTSAINRVVEDINHRFTVDVLARDFVSADLALSTKNLRRDPNSPSDVLERVDVEAVTNRLRELLEVLNADERTVAIDKTHAIEIKEYLDLLEVTVDIPIVDASNYNLMHSHVAVSQPGLRYAQAKALITALMDDDEFRSMKLEERQAVTRRILSEIRGRMLEDIVLLETGAALPEAKVFKLQFPIGEFDMVVFWPEWGCCSLYEVKHSAEEHPSQRRHLLDPEKLTEVERRYGTIKERCVLYRGEAGAIEGVTYKNVETYLRSLGSGQ
ncbi:MAG: AAA family ATPase [Coriobacteriales bacterium]|nr:AAA family ATPase [Coriobacteriales bacterium]